MRMSLRFKLLAPILGVVAAGLAVSAYLGYRKAYESLWTTFIRDSETVVESTGRELDITLKGVFSLLAMQADEPQVLALLQQGQLSDDGRRQLQANLAQIVEQNPAFEAANVADAKGNLVASSEPESVKGVNVADRDYFRESMQGRKTVAQPVISRISGKAVFMVASPVKSGDTVIGVLYVRLNLEKLYQASIAPIKIGKSGYLVVTDRNGLILGHPDGKLVMKMNIGEQAWGKRILEQRNGFTEYDFEGVQKGAIFRFLPQAGWFLVMAVSRADVAEAVSGLALSALYTGIGSCLAVSLAVVVIVGGVIRALKRCVGYAGAVSAGDYGQVLKVSGNDELADLAASLRAMVDSQQRMILLGEEQTRKAEQQAALAQEAKLQADQALAQAQSARRSGMLEAASKLEGVVEVMGMASEELFKLIESSKSGAEDQSRRVAETATAMEQMTATVLEVAQNATKAADTAMQARTRAESGAGVVNQAVAGIDEVMDQTVRLKTEMAELGRRAQDIGNIMNVISDIADQTNLLALNAAIEAARAGDAGRGFAVVADEVRKLAEKTMTATREVGEAIAGIQKGTMSNVAMVEQSAESIESATGLANASGRELAGIVRLVEDAANQIQSIATAAEEQSSTTEEINRSVDGINKVSSDTAMAMTESSLAVEELRRQSVVLSELISELKGEGDARALPS